MSRIEQSPTSTFQISSETRRFATIYSVYIQKTIYIYIQPGHILNIFVGRSIKFTRRRHPRKKYMNYDCVFLPRWNLCAVRAHSYGEAIEKRIASALNIAVTLYMRLLLFGGKCGKHTCTWWGSWTVLSVVFLEKCILQKASRTRHNCEHYWIIHFQDKR